MSDERISFHNENTRLVMGSVSLEDSGTYSVAIRKETSTGVFSTVASTSVELIVYGEYIPPDMSGMEDNEG